jgi:hypothetical protein
MDAGRLRRQNAQRTTLSAPTAGPRDLAPDADFDQGPESASGHAKIRRVVAGLPVQPHNGEAGTTHARRRATMTDCRQCGAALSEDAETCSECGTGVPGTETGPSKRPDHEWAVVNGPAWLLARQRSRLGQGQANGEVEAPKPGWGARIIMVAALVALAVLMVLVILLLRVA